MTYDIARRQTSECRGFWWTPGTGGTQRRVWGQSASGQAASAPGPRANSDLRASDQERQATADQLKVHLAAGRLDMNEYEERVQQALAARTRRDLDGLLSDLPWTGSAAVQPPPSRLFFAPVLFVVAVLATVILTIGAVHWFFFPWWIIPVGFFLLSRRWRRGWRPNYSSD
jgi:Domain of unknown function (DUF1707)